MTLQPIGTSPCLACAAPVRRSRPECAICKGCVALGEAAFKVAYPYSDPTSHQRHRNMVFGDRARLVALIRAEHARRGRGAA